MLRVDFYATTESEQLPAAGEASWYIRSQYDGTPWEEVFERFMRTVDTTQVTDLSIGYWGLHDTVDTFASDKLIEVADRFPALRALFIGDMSSEDCDISSLWHAELTPVFTVFPKLERFEVRGSESSMLRPFRSETLRTLRIESGGLEGDVVQAVAASDLPNLEHLDIWLGDPNYGGDATVADLAPILGGQRLPALRHLGLEDSVLQDEIAAAVAGAPVVARLESLSLAMGTLTDQGAEALLVGQPLTHLRRLDLRHHFLSDTMMERVQAALPGVEVDMMYRNLADDGIYYIEVAE
ncbi:STM4015 family protein [Spirillospora sp. NBC_01491]|uniref:STM4015 family protein n=1 Tax=Spirillospora sp. NBC_01491 TaxID=2976007 RepID=UPI002E341F23|nr:STM4015 family protein [Spirillospora sp. NBC_01491]